MFVFLALLFLLIFASQEAQAEMPNWQGTSLDASYGYYLTKLRDEHTEINLSAHLHPDLPVLRWFNLGFQVRGAIGELETQPDVFAVRGGFTWPGDGDGFSMWGGFQPQQLFSDDPAKAWISGGEVWYQKHGDRAVFAAEYVHERKFTVVWATMDFDVLSTGQLGLALSANSNGPLLGGARISWGFPWARLGFEFDFLLADLYVARGNPLPAENPLIGFKLFASWY